MTDEDKQYARLLLSGFALNGLVSHSGNLLPESAAGLSVAYADAILEALEEPKAGLPAIKRRKVK